MISQTLNSFLAAQPCREVDSHKSGRSVGAILTAVVPLRPLGHSGQSKGTSDEPEKKAKGSSEQKCWVREPCKA